METPLALPAGSGPLATVPEVLAHLQELTALPALLVVRRDGERLDVLASHMVGEIEGTGHSGGHDAALVRAAALESQAVAGDLVAGVDGLALPLLDSGGTRIATLCGVPAGGHPAAVGDGQLPTLKLVGRLLGALLDQELRSARQAQSLQHAEAEAATDPLTGLGNRRRWESLLRTAEARCRRFGVTAAVLVADLDDLKRVNDEHGHDAGDDLIRRAAAVFADRLGRDGGAVRLGGDEFAALLVEATPEDVAAAAGGLTAALQAVGVAASIGTGLRRAAGDLATAWRDADAAMYADKRARRAARGLADRRTGPERVDVAEALERLLATARAQLGMEVAYISELTAGEQVVRYAVPAGGPITSGEVWPLEATLCQRMLDGELPSVIEDTLEHPAAAALPVSERLRSYVGVPLALPDGTRYGTLCTADSQPNRALTPRDGLVLRVLADAAGELLARHRSAQERRTEVVQRIDGLLAGGREPGIGSVYQPVVDLSDGTWWGAEALSRFPGGPSSPHRWFSEAAEVGAGPDLELAAAGLAVRALDSLPGVLALNFSAATIATPGFARLVDGLPVSRLAVELSEQDIASDPDGVCAALRRHRMRGLRLAVDGAGTGMSSLRSVLQLAPDFIKLDLSLVRGLAEDPAERAVGAAVLMFAERIGAAVIAESIETPEELDVLRDLGVPYGQGRLICAPVELEAWPPGAAATLPQSGPVRLDRVREARLRPAAAS